jgi:hypothetical protein
MSVNKYKQAIDGVSFSPDFEINLKRRLKGETLITMTPAKKSPIRTIALAGMSVAACFICFFAVKIASERLDAGLVSEPAVTSFETEIEAVPEMGTTVIGSPRQAPAAFNIAPAAGGENAADDSLQVPPEGSPELFGVYNSAAPPYYNSVPAVYRPEVALEGLLEAFDSGTFIVSDGEFKTTEAGTTVAYADDSKTVADDADVAESSGEGIVTVSTAGTDAFSETVRAYLEQLVTAGEKESFSEHKTGEEQYRIDIYGEDGTLLYSVWTFDNCVLVERFAPDGLMKAYVEMHATLNR